MQAPVVLILMHGPEPLIRPAYPTVAVPTSSQPAATSQTQISAAAGVPAPSTEQPSQLQHFAAASGALPKQHRPQGRQHVLAFAACASTWLLALLGLSELLLWRLGLRSKQLQRLDGLYLEQGEGQSATHWTHRSYLSSLQVSPSARLEVLLHHLANAAAVTVTAGAHCKQRCLPALLPTCGASAQPSSAAPVPSPHHLSPSPWRSTLQHILSLAGAGLRLAPGQLEHGPASGCTPAPGKAQQAAALHCRTAGPRPHTQHRHVVVFLRRDVSWASSMLQGLLPPGHRGHGWSHHMAPPTHPCVCLSPPFHHAVLPQALPERGRCSPLHGEALCCRCSSRMLKAAA